jgi:hypothetical protein
MAPRCFSYFTSSQLALRGTGAFKSLCVFKTPLWFYFYSPKTGFGVFGKSVPVGVGARIGSYESSKDTFFDEIPLYDVELSSLYRLVPLSAKKVF